MKNIEIISKEDEWVFSAVAGCLSFAISLITLPSQVGITFAILAAVNFYHVADLRGTWRRLYIGLVFGLSVIYGSLVELVHHHKVQLNVEDGKQNYLFGGAMLALAAWALICRIRKNRRLHEKMSQRREVGEEESRETFHDLEKVAGIVYKHSEVRAPLVEWYERIRDVPIVTFSVKELCISVREKYFPETIVAKAIQMLEAEPLAGELYHGELASSFYSYSEDFWREHPALAQRLLPVLRGVRETVGNIPEIVWTISRLDALQGLVVPRQP